MIGLLTVAGVKNFAQLSEAKEPSIEAGWHLTGCKYNCHLQQGGLIQAMLLARLSIDHQIAI